MQVQPVSNEQPREQAVRDIANEADYSKATRTQARKLYAQMIGGDLYRCECGYAGPSLPDHYCPECGDVLPT